MPKIKEFECSTIGELKEAIKNLDDDIPIKLRVLSENGWQSYYLTDGFYAKNEPLIEYLQLNGES